MLKIHAPLWMLIGLFVLPAPSHATGFEAFLGNLDQGCRGGDAFETFRASLIKRYATDPIDPQQAIEIPETLKPFMGPIEARHTPNPSGYYHVFVPLKGKFRGLDVVAVEFAFGDENGIHASAVIFANSLDDVNNALAKTVEAANKRAVEEHAKLIEEGGGDADPETLAIEFIEGHAKLTCDMST